ncbi:MAG: 6-bladed beta-propeller [Marinifilaceae bacterium]
MKEFSILMQAFLDINIIIELMKSILYLLHNCILFSVVFFCLAACSQQSSSSIFKISDKNADVFDAVQLIDTIEVLDLLCGDDFVLPNADKVVQLSNRLFLFDQKNSIIDVYNPTDGKLLRRLNKKGHSANEYIAISDIAFSDSLIYLLCLNKILIFDHELEYRKIIRMQDIKGLESVIGFRDLYFYNQTLLLYNDNEKSVYQLDLADYSVKQILTDERCNKYVGYAVANPIFHKISDSVVLIDMDGGDMIYKFENNKVSPWAQLDYEGKEKAMNYNVNTASDKNAFLPTPKYIRQTLVVDSVLYLNYVGGVVRTDIAGSSYQNYKMYGDINKVEEYYVPWDAVQANWVYDYYDEKHQLSMETFKQRYPAATIVFSNRSNEDAGNECATLLIYKMRN